MNHLLLILIALFISGCANKSIYYWGNYESTLYMHTVKKESPNKEIELLLEDVKDASAAKKPLPPGFFAQLGLLYTQVGSTQLAEEAFAKERASHADSQVMMDRFLKIKKGK